LQKNLMPDSSCFPPAGLKNRSILTCTEVYFLHWQNDTRYKVIDL